MSKEKYTSMIESLSKAIGIDGLSPDEDMYCCLGFDEKIVVHIQYNEENDIVMLFAQLGKIDEDKQSDIYPRILKANLFWQGTGGATIGVDDETSEVLMSYQLAMQLLDEEKFQDLLQGFVNTAELWFKTLEAYQKGEVEAPTA